MFSLVNANKTEANYSIAVSKWEKEEKVRRDRVTKGQCTSFDFMAVMDGILFIIY